MLGWLRSLMGLFRRDERELFRYWDGHQHRAIDPLVAWRQLWSIGDYARDCEIAGKKSPDGSMFYPIEQVREAEDGLRDRTRQIFGVVQWTEAKAGLTWEETDELLNQFMLYIADLKKKLSPSPTSSEPSESTEPGSLRDTDDFPPGAEPAWRSMPSESTDAALSGR